MKFSIAGITFAKQDNPEVAKLRPTGKVDIVPEPDNEHDAKALRVEYNGVKLGYIPRSAQKYVNGNVTIDYTKIHEDELSSVVLKVDGENEDTEDTTEKKEYMRVTTFIGYLNYTGSSDGLIRWAITEGLKRVRDLTADNLYNAYKEALGCSADAGTAMHSTIESFFNTKALSGLPDGFSTFYRKYQPVPISMERRFFDDTLMVTGQYDFYGNIKGHKNCIVDWKSSKRVSVKHKMQVAIYAKNVGATSAAVVCFGAQNKQKFSVSILDDDDINRYYAAAVHLRKIMDLLKIKGKVWG